LTGESRPVGKLPDDSVIGGSVNVGSPLTLRIDRVGESTRLASIQRLMERAATEKPKIVEMADRIAMRFVGALLILALVTGVLWWWLDPSQALWVFVAVLVVSCPCALSLATPAALTVATGVLSRNGVLVTRGHAIETLARATHFVFDKTGTLTEGRPALIETLAPGPLTAGETIALAGAIELGSEHPIGRALREAAAQSSAPPVEEVCDARAITGRGMEARWRDQTLRLGNPEFAGELHGTMLPDSAVQWQVGGDTIVALANDRGWLAVFRLSDRLRAGAAEAMAALKDQGIQLAVLSGDTPETVAKVATDLGVGSAQGGMTPEGKHDAIRRLQESGALVAMVGDGVNDAPVLAQAHVSVAMGGGTDLARSQGDVVLLSNDLRHLAAGVTTARRTMRIIRQNLTWAFVYNLVAIPLAMAGWVTPWLAGIGMSASSLMVVLNALRLQRDGREGA
jgi:Cu2+-exporting ATPase